MALETSAKTCSALVLFCSLPGEGGDCHAVQEAMAGELLEQADSKGLLPHAKERGCLGTWHMPVPRCPACGPQATRSLSVCAGRLPANAA